MFGVKRRMRCWAGFKDLHHEQPTVVTRLYPLDKAMN